MTRRTHEVGGRRVRAGRARAPLYTPAERARRDATRWTLVQGALAPAQFVVMLVSVALVARYLRTGDGLAAAHLSVLAKTAALYAIMVTGALWEKAVFGRYLFAPAFFWEDAVSFVVVAVHTLYVVAFAGGLLGPHALMYVALAAYALYAVNAGQFVRKLRLARRDEGAVQLAGAAA